MSKLKHTGENIAGVTVHMRFIPLKADPEQQKFGPLKMDNKLLTTITVHVNDTQKGTPDNLQEFKIPKISKLALEGETFVRNKVKLIETIFAPKGWLGPKALTKRLEKYAMFMTNTATTDFTICQCTARKEFITRHGTVSEALRVKITTQQNEFLGWLKQKSTLKKLSICEKIIWHKN